MFMNKKSLLRVYIRFYFILIAVAAAAEYLYFGLFHFNWQMYCSDSELNSENIFATVGALTLYSSIFAALGYIPMFIPIKRRIRMIMSILLTVGITWWCARFYVICVNC